jgi:IclR family transcriptional regulator, acetate operon repressor
MENGLKSPPAEGSPFRLVRAGRSAYACPQSRCRGGRESMTGQLYRLPAAVSVESGSTIPESLATSEVTASRGVESVSRAFDLLEAIADQQLGLVELGRATGLRPSTTHRMLATLTSRGYVRRVPGTNRYTLGYRALRLAGGVERDTSELRQVALEFMLRAQRVAGADTSLFVLSNMDAVCVALLRADRPDADVSQPGERVPAHATAAGKALLAYQPQADLRQTLETATLDRLTPLTVVRPDHLLRDLEAARRQGYAVVREECVSRQSGVAAPVFDASGYAVASVSLSGTTGHLCRLAPWSELGELVASTALDASRELGYTGESADRWTEPAVQTDDCIEREALPGL